MRCRVALGLIAVSLGLLEVSAAAAQEQQRDQPGPQSQQSSESRADGVPATASAGGRDRGGRPTEALVEERLRSLSEMPGAEELAEGTLRQARRALDRSRELAAAGRQSAGERARQIAWAALSLASRQIARAQEERALARARREFVEARARVRRARQALAHAQRQGSQRPLSEPSSSPSPPRVPSE